MSISIRSLAHVGIRVHDLDRSLAFYELLGFVKTLGPVGPEPVAILHHPAGIEINLILNAGEAQQVNLLMDVPEKHPGYTHMALWVDDLDETERVLTAAGYPRSGQMAYGTTRMIFVRDPDGNVVEFDATV